jgi:cell wall-associated NlpC family hydrolase
LLFSLSTAFAVEVPIEEFSIKAYSQNIYDYLAKDSQEYDQSLLKPEYQAAQLQLFYIHYYASGNHGLSPWSEQMVNAIYPSVKKIEEQVIDEFDNQKQEPINYHYGENFKAHDEIWLNKITKSMQLDALETTHFSEKNRAIVTTNTYARALPDYAPDFFHFSLPGEGFPFDNLQESALWVGTPLYVLHNSQDKAWSLVLTPDAYIAWVKSSDIAYATPEFIDQWQVAAQRSLMAITQTEASVLDEEQQFLFSTYIGAVFPLAAEHEETNTLLIPSKQNQKAVIAKAVVAKRAAQLMPVSASPKNIAVLIQELQNRPYGWGGAFFFNDCSQELKSLFTPLGLWLPRNSAQQARYAKLDLSQKDLSERLTTLKSQGHPLMTLIYIGGHVMLYIGKDQTQEAITYQNIWGLAPASKDKRYVIGQSLLLPLLKSYPENSDARSLADATYFKLIQLDELATQAIAAPKFAKQFMPMATTLSTH